MAAPETLSAHARHNRDASFHVNYKPEQVQTLAKEILDGTIADVNLSLFTYWIREKAEHYEEAKKHIRELGLDQGYATNRIENECLRELVEATSHLRPGYDYGASSDEDEDDSSSERPSETEQRLQTRALPRSPLASFPKMTGINAILRSHSYARSNRASPAIDPKVKAMLRSRQSSSPLRPQSPWMTKSDSSLGMKKKETPSSATSITCSNLSSDREYPPDTPDRPAPLSIRSRGTDSAPATALLRSVSTPIRQQQTQRFACSPSADWNRTEIRPAVSPTQERQRKSNSHADTEEKGEIFEASNGVPSRRSNLFADEVDTRHGSRSFEPTDAVGRFELEPHELAESESNSPMAQSRYFSSGFEETAPPAGTSVFDFARAQTEGAAANNDDLETLPQNVSGTENERSSTEDMSSSSTQDSQQHAQYVFARPRNRVLNAKTIPAPTPAQRRAAAQARRAARPPNLPGMSGFHRPLPLRSYESEAFLYPTTRAQGGASHNRTISLSASPTRGRRSLPLGGLDEMTRRIGPSNLRIPSEARNAAEASSPTPSRNASVRSNASNGVVDLSQFPAVPQSTSLPSPNSLSVVYRSVTEAYMRQALQRTRARGAQLSIVHWASLSSFERAWREMNEQLLIAIYGRKDVVLTDADVDFVACIAREMRDGVGQIPGYEWVGELF